MGLISFYQLYLRKLIQISKNKKVKTKKIPRANATLICSNCCMCCFFISLILNCVLTNILECWWGLYATHLTGSVTLHAPVSLVIGHVYILLRAYHTSRRPGSKLPTSDRQPWLSRTDMESTQQTTLRDV